PAVVATQSNQVLEDRQRLDRLSHAVKGNRQIVRRLGSQGAGDRVIEDRLLTAPEFLQQRGQVEIEPDISREPPPTGPQDLLGELRRPHPPQGHAQRKDLPITKAGSPLLWWALVEAAWRAVCQGAAWRRVYEGIRKRTGGKKAIVAVARRLLCVLYAMLR